MRHGSSRGSSALNLSTDATSLSRPQVIDFPPHT
jgi:hypothetical protein